MAGGAQVAGFQRIAEDAERNSVYLSPKIVGDTMLVGVGATGCKMQIRPTPLSAVDLI